MCLRERTGIPTDFIWLIKYRRAKCRQQQITKLEALIPNKPILITGAGIGGLVAALALQQRGFEVALYEQAHDLREVGAGVQIRPNGTRVLYSLGLADAIRAVAVEPTGKEVRLWNSGATWPLFDLGPTCVARYGSPYLMFHRGDLQMALVKAVREANPAAIHLGASVTQSTETEDGVVIDLVDGRTIAGSLLVGADGVHSTTRSALFGTAKARFTGCMAWRGVVPMERLPGHLARQVGVNSIGPAGTSSPIPFAAES